MKRKNHRIKKDKQGRAHKESFSVDNFKTPTPTFSNVFGDCSIVTLPKRKIKIDISPDFTRT